MTAYYDIANSFARSVVSTSIWEHRKREKMFSIEMRRRVILSVYFGKLFFEPDVQKIVDLERNLEEVQ